MVYPFRPLFFVQLRKDRRKIIIFRKMTDSTNRYISGILPEVL